MTRKQINLENEDNFSAVYQTNVNGIQQICFSYMALGRRLHVSFFLNLNTIMIQNMLERDCSK